MAKVKPYFIIDCNQRFFIHLVPVDNNFIPEELLALQMTYQQDDCQLVHLWEDVWYTKRDQVLSRLYSFLGLNKTIHGRKTKIDTLTLKQSADFLDNYHLQGYVKAKYHYGLTIEQELVAVASFSEARPMKSKGPTYQSAELIRFASSAGITVTGGLSKLIRHFIKQVQVNDIMTYADRDWSLGIGYDKLGFRLTNTTAPAYLYLYTENKLRYFPHRLPKSILNTFKAQNSLNLDDFLKLNGYIKMFNTGNLKYHLLL